jgi:mRNA-degrading endonuclease toxin of MazEF toxin-antitoxin module
MMSPNPHRGDIYWVPISQSHTVGSEQYKRRPWVIVSSNAIVQVGMVIGVPLSQKVHKQNASFRIFVANSNILYEQGTTLIPGDRVALTEQVRALSVQRLELPLQGRLTDTALYSVEAGLAFVLEMP